MTPEDPPRQPACAPPGTCSLPIWPHQTPPILHSRPTPLPAPSPRAQPPLAPIHLGAPPHSAGPSLPGHLHAPAQPPPAATPLQTPLHVTLLSFARVHLQASRRLSPRLNPLAQPDPAALELSIRVYHRHIAMAIASLRSILSLTQSATADVPLEDELKARWMLAQVLVSETSGTATQVADLVQQTLGLVRQRSGLAWYAFGLREMEIWSLSEDGNAIEARQLRKKLERAIESTMRLGVVDEAHIDWFYRFQLLLSHICAQRHQPDASLAALEPVLTLSKTRGDMELWVFVRARQAKISLDRGEWARAGDQLRSIAAVARLPKLEGGLVMSEPENKQELFTLGPPLERYIMLLIGLYHFALAEVVSALQCVSHLQESLSRALEPGELEGTYQIPIRPPTQSPSSAHIIDSTLTSRFQDASLVIDLSSFVTVKTFAYPLLRILIHLLSAAAHFDGHGKKPKCVEYLGEALSQIEKLLTTTMSGDHQLALVRSSLGSRLEQMNLEGMLIKGQLAILRSNFVGADQILWHAIQSAVHMNSWARYGARLSFLKAMLSHATGNASQARASLRAALRLAPRGSLGAEVSVLVKVGYVLLDPDDEEGAVEGLTKELAALAGKVVGRLELGIQLVLAMRCGAIMRAKYHLTNALDEAHKLANTHVKTLLLGLLGNLFLYTRSEQAVKMLQSCSKACASFREQDVSDVGMAGLGIWVGEKLLGLYKAIGDVERGKKQALVNEAYRNALKTVPLL